MLHNVMLAFPVLVVITFWSPSLVFCSRQPFVKCNNNRCSLDGCCQFKWLSVWVVGRGGLQAVWPLQKWRGTLLQQSTFAIVLYCGLPGWVGRECPPLYCSHYVHQKGKKVDRDVSAELRVFRLLLAINPSFLGSVHFSMSDLGHIVPSVKCHVHCEFLQWYLFCELHESGHVSADSSCLLSK